MLKLAPSKIRIPRMLCILCLISGALCFLATAAIDFTSWNAPISGEMFSKLGAAMMLSAVFFYIVNSGYSYDVAQKIMNEGAIGVGVILTTPDYYDDPNADNWWVDLHMAIYPDTSDSTNDQPLFESRIKQSITNTGKEYFKIGMHFPVRFDLKEEVALITVPPALPSFFRF